MVKSTEDVVKDFNEIVNMTAEELEAFLETDESNTTGFTREGEDESVGHQSGTKIVDILKRNPEKDPSKYTEEDQEHMRKVVAYCKRHLAQEGHLKMEKTEEELEKMKSTRSLKNWGHDPLKSEGGAEGGENKPKSSGKPASKKDEKPQSKSAKPASKKSAAPAKEDDEAEKPKSKSAAKPASKKATKGDGEKEEVDKPKSKSAAKPASKKKEEAAPADEEEKDAGSGSKRSGDKAEKTDKPAKKAKAEKPVTEGTRKPPGRGAKKA